MYIKETLICQGWRCVGKLLLSRAQVTQSIHCATYYIS